MQDMSARRPEPVSTLPTQIAVGAAGIAVLLAGAAVLWVRHGEAVYVDRLFSMIANCFG